ncbi:MAG: DUF839 domain-containing protein [Lysobacterales bacterium]|jgi:hypothetical protein
MVDSGRRRLLRHGLVAAGGLGLGGAGLWQLMHPGEPLPVHPASGPLQPAADANTGLEILQLPAGFRYRTLAWAGAPLADGYAGPGAADGMGVVADRDGVVTLVRNHELKGTRVPMGDPKKAWDVTGGGTTTLTFDIRTERLLDSRISLGGTLNNCSGGVTPWGTWLSCEEAPVTPALLHYGLPMRQWRWHVDTARKPHGYVFEVRPEGEAQPQPIVSMGQFYHEAAAVHPASGIVYMTEDNSPDAGFYRFVPDTPGRLDAGGRLQMMQVHGRTELKKHLPLQQPLAFSWVDIEKPEQGHSPGTHDCAGVVRQGLAAGATAFVALEGCTCRDNAVYFTSKSGGAGTAGQIFRVDLEHNTLALIYEAADVNGFSGPDNLVVSPGGSLMVCEDRAGIMTGAQRIAWLDTAGRLFAFCQVNPRIEGRYGGFDLRDTVLGSEWSGACFSGDGRWLFANIYNPGITVAITGPWDTVPI